MAWRTRDGQASADRPNRRGTEAVKGYQFAPSNAPGKRMVHEIEAHLRVQAMSKEERTEFINRILWGDDD